MSGYGKLSLVIGAVLSCAVGAILSLAFANSIELDGDDFVTIDQIEPNGPWVVQRYL
jgi:hypothetical protein